MKEHQASRTAEHMALFRALETVRPRERRLFEDRLAHGFLSRPLRLIVTLSRPTPIGAAVREDFYRQRH
jgi:O-methyltransferase involved in polyketide biosynthesis